MVVSSEDLDGNWKRVNITAINKTDETYEAAVFDNSTKPSAYGTPPPVVGHWLKVYRAYIRTTVPPQTTTNEWPPPLYLPGKEPGMWVVQNTTTPHPEVPGATTTTTTAPQSDLDNILKRAGQR